MHWQLPRRRRAPTLDWIVDGRSSAAVSRPQPVRSSSLPKSIGAAIDQFANEESIVWRGLRILEIAGGETLADYFATREPLSYVLLSDPESAGRLAERHPDARILCGNVRQFGESSRKKFDWIVATVPISERSYSSRSGESSNGATIAEAMEDRRRLASIVAVGGRLALEDRIQSVNDPDWVAQRSLLERAGMTIVRRLPALADRCLTIWRRKS